MKSLNLAYLTRLDHLRFFAAILVIFHHFRGTITLDTGHWTLDTGHWTLDTVSNFIKYWLINGSSGVSLFMFLTGFLFCTISQYGEKRINYKGFIYNRILRIFPLMITMVFIVISIDRTNSTPMDIFRILTLQLNTGHPYTGWGHNIFPTGPIWTIAVEFQFYLLFPFFALFLSKYGVKYLIGLLLLCIFLRFNVIAVLERPIYWNFYHTIIGRLDQFIIGMIFAVIIKRGYLDFLSSKVISALLIMFSIAMASYLFTFERETIGFISLSFPIEAICWGLIVACYLTVDFPKLKIINLSLAKLGEISFSLYILHLPIGNMVNKILDLPANDQIVTLSDSLLFSFIRLVPIIVISFLTYYIIEKPFMSLRVKYTS